MLSVTALNIVFLFPGSARHESNDELSWHLDSVLLIIVLFAIKTRFGNASFLENNVGALVPDVGMRLV